MIRLVVLCVAVLSCVWLSACRSESSGGGGDDSDADEDSDSDADGDLDSDANAETDSDVVAVTLYDFEAAAPWYSCPTEDFPEGTTVINAMNQEYHFITFGDTGVDARNLWADVEFPAESDWAQVGLRFNLECPQSGLCDYWDRYGSVQLVLNPDEPQEDWEYLELARHVTPYRREMCQYIDVTPLASLLTGSQKIHSFIDTWVGPEHSSGEGWRVTVDFVFYPGGEAQVDDVINIWGKRHINVGDTDPAANVDSQIDAVTVTIPAHATKVEAHAITTGHGFGFTSNCAEFCQMRQDVVVNDTVHSFLPWRNDCGSNPVSPQGGTWDYNRNGWCPGAIAVGEVIDITDSLTLGAENTVDFDIRTSLGNEYENTSTQEGTPYEVISLKLYVYR